MPQGINFVIITPVRDEVQHIEKTLTSVTKQTIQPREWVIVDDGSTDGTGKILDNFCSRFDWIKVVHRENRGYRAAGGGVVEAFYEGYSSITESRFEFIAKLDGDLSFSADYFEMCFNRFSAEARLGIGGGIVCFDDGGQAKEEAVGDPLFHVRGAVKIYRRACWDQIGPLIRAPGWDTIDEVKANMLGWITRTFRDITLIQHKPTGLADGSWRNWYKNGRANYIAGYHPLFMLGKCARRALRSPFFGEAFALWIGFCSGYTKRIPQIEDQDVIRYLRRQQLRRLTFRPSIYG
jgi:glycosyltransferase involved in cell wall biosynthesis